MKIELPFPVSGNHYWKKGKNRKSGKDQWYIHQKGIAFREAVYAAVLEQHGVFKPLTGPIRLTVELTPPDRRIRDLDNFEGKSLWDALRYANVYMDDSQIKERHGYMREPSKESGATVILEEL